MRSINIETHYFASPYAGQPQRQVDVWLPEGLALDGGSYPFLLMHDGENCQSTDSYGHGGWQVPQVMQSLIDQGKLPPMIAIFVHCDSENRIAEYSPGPWSYVGQQIPGLLAAHQQWLVETVLPALRRRYPLSSRREEAAIGGSSMGGVASWDTAFRYPQQFGKLMIMSSPLRLCAEGLCFRHLAQADADCRVEKIYLDAGTEFAKVPGDFADDNREMADALINHGYRPGESMQFAIFDGDAHNESFWRKRLPGALTFLFGTDEMSRSVCDEN